MNSESQAVRNIRDFFSKISEKIPKVFLNNLSIFIKLYDNDSYCLRNAITDIITNILKVHLSSNETDQELS